MREAQNAAFRDTVVWGCVFKEAFGVVGVLSWSSLGLEGL